MLNEDNKWLFRPAPVSDYKINEELELLARALGSELQGRFTSGIFADSPGLSVRRKGFNCRIEGQMIATGDGKGITLSTHVLLPKKVDYRLHMERVASSHLFRQVHAEDSVSLNHNLPTQILERVMPLALQDALSHSGLSFSLVLLGDRLSMKVYGAHKHKLYLALLDAMIAVATELVSIAG